MTNNLGAGVSPVGVGPYGFGTPATAPEPGGAVNRIANGTQEGSLAISLDQGTRGQYVFDSSGRRVGTGNVRHMVILAIATVRGTCCVLDLGNRFSETRKIYDSFVEEQRARLTEALANLVSRKLITIDSIKVEPRNGAPAQTHVLLTDLTTNRPIDLIL